MVSTPDTAAKLPFPVASLQTAVHNIASRVTGHAGSRLAVVEKGDPGLVPDVGRTEVQVHIP